MAISFRHPSIFWTEFINVIQSSSLSNCKRFYSWLLPLLRGQSELYLPFLRGIYSSQAKSFIRSVWFEFWMKGSSFLLFSNQVSLSNQSRKQKACPNNHSQTLPMITASTDCKEMTALLLSLYCSQLHFATAVLGHLILFNSLCRKHGHFIKKIQGMPFCDGQTRHKQLFQRSTSCQFKVYFILSTLLNQQKILKCCISHLASRSCSCNFANVSLRISPCLCSSATQFVFPFHTSSTPNLQKRKVSYLQKYNSEKPIFSGKKDS